LQLSMRVKGPEPGYVATPIIVVQAALEFLEQRGKIASALGVSGGVFTPGAALLSHGDGLVQRLKVAGFDIEEA